MFANFAILLGWRISKLLPMRHMLHYLSASQQKESNKVHRYFSVSYPKYPLKSSFFWITFLKISMDQKSKNKSCVRQCPKTIGKVSYKSKSKKQSYNSINEKFLKHVFSLWRNWWRQNFHTWYLTSPRTYGRKHSLSCWFYVKL